MNYRELYHYGQKTLSEAGIAEAELDARLLLEWICETTRHDLFLRGDMELKEDSILRYQNAIAKRAARIPLQHITGVQEFMGLTFLTGPQVLTPRQDTEILVETALKHLHDGMRILDMCTGSGCILLSLLNYSNDCIGVGVDLSQDAIELAERNGEKLGLQAEWIQSDLFNALPKEGKFDLLVSNPPYIRTQEITALMPEVKDHEPFMALDGKEDGLYFYKEILNQAPPYLNRGAWIVFEIGHDQGDDVSELMQEYGLCEISIIRDYAGCDRVVAGVFLEEKNV